MVKAQRFIYERAFSGVPEVSNFRLEQYELPALGNGG